MNDTIRTLLLSILAVLIIILLGIGIGSLFYKVTVYNRIDTERPKNIAEYLDVNYEYPYAYELVDNYVVAYKYNNQNKRYEYLNYYSCIDKCEVKEEDLTNGYVILIDVNNTKDIYFKFNKK